MRKSKPVGKINLNRSNLDLKPKQGGTCIRCGFTSKITREHDCDHIVCVNKMVKIMSVGEDKPKQATKCTHSLYTTKDWVLCEICGKAKPVISKPKQVTGYTYKDWIKKTRKQAGILWGHEGIVEVVVNERH